MGTAVSVLTLQCPLRTLPGLGILRGAQGCPHRARPQEWGGPVRGAEAALQLERGGANRLALGQGGLHHGEGDVNLIGLEFGFGGQFPHLTVVQDFTC